MNDRAVAPPGMQRLSVLLQTAAMACLLAVLVARPFLSEAPFRITEFSFTETEMPVAHEPADLVRVTLAMILLASAALWGLSQVCIPQRRTRTAWLAGLLVVLAGWSAWSACGAVDARGAWDGWLDQMATIAGGLVMLQLAQNPARRRLLLAVLVGLAGVLAAKTIYQVLVDIPERIASFRAEGAKQLAQIGMEPDTPQARMFEKRLTDPAAFGYQDLSNVFAGLLVIPVLTAIGLAADAFGRARQALATRRDKTQIPAPLLAAILSGVVAVMGVVGLALSRSKGGIGGALIGLVAFVVIALRPGFFARHRRKLLVAALLAIVGLGGVVTALGLTRGQVPGRSLQVRWEYWVGAARLLRDHALTGVGSDNFGPAYLRYRLPASAESPKTAHNVFFDAAAQYGLPGAAIYLLILGGLIVLAARPVPPPASPEEPDPIRHQILWCIGLTMAVFLARLIWVGTLDPDLLLLDAVAPAVVFGLCLAIALWAGRGDGPSVAGPLTRIAAVAGLAGFLVQNLVEYTLWSPSSATVFWLAAGGLAAGVIVPQAKVGHRWSYGILSAGTLAMLALAGTFLFQPVYERTVDARAAQRAFAGHNPTDLTRCLKKAIEDDPLDATAPAALAKLNWALSHSQGDPQQAMAQAAEYARLAFEREPTSPNATLCAHTLWLNGRQEQALKMARQAVELDPMDVLLRLDYAKMLLAADKKPDAYAQTQIIRSIDDSRPADSDLRLTPRERLDLGKVAGDAGMESPSAPRSSGDPPADGTGNG